MSLMRFTTVFPSTFIPQDFSISAPFSTIPSPNQFKIYDSSYPLDIPLPIKYFIEKYIFIHPTVTFVIVNIYLPIVDIEWTI